MPRGKSSKPVDMSFVDQGWVQAADLMARPPISLYTPVAGLDDVSLIDTLVSASDDPLAKAIQAEQGKYLSEAFSQLSARERFVVSERVLYETDRLTVADMLAENEGAAKPLSGQRIDAIRDTALFKMFNMLKGHEEGDFPHKIPASAHATIKANTGKISSCLAVA